MVLSPMVAREVLTLPLTGIWSRQHSQFSVHIFFSSRDSPVVDLGLLLIHEDFYGF